MKITIEGTLKEIAALAEAWQERQPASTEDLGIGFPLLNSPDAYAHDLVKKNDNVSDCSGGTQ